MKRFSLVLVQLVASMVILLIPSQIKSQPYILRNSGMISEGQNHTLTAFTLLPDERMVVTGHKPDLKPSLLILYDTTGTVQHKSLIGGPGYSYIPGICGTQENEINGILLFRDSLLICDSAYDEKVRSGMVYFTSDREGKPRYVRFIAGNFKGQVSDCVTDPGGNFWVAGWFRKMNFSGNDFRAIGRKDAFLIRTKEQKPPELFIFSGSGDEEISRILPSGDGLMLAGKFTGSVVLGDTTLYSGTKDAIFLTHMDNSGEISHTHKLLTGTSLTLHALSENPVKGCYLGGTFSGRLNLQDTTIHARGQNDLFLCKTDTLLQLRRISSFGGPGDELLTGLATDSAGRLFLTAGFTGMIPSASDTLVSADRFSDAFFAEADTADLSLLWKYRFSGRNEQSVQYLKTGKDQNIYLTGYSGSDFTLAGQSVNTGGGVFTALFTNPCKWLHFGLPDSVWICSGATDTLTAGDYPEVTWYPGAVHQPWLEINRPGIYSAWIEDRYGCHDSDTIRVLSDSVTLSFEITDETIPPGGNGTVHLNYSGGKEPMTIYWDDGYNGTQRSGLTAGDYVVTVTDSLGCTATDTAIVEQQITSGIYDLQAWPNPLHDITHILYSLPRDVRVEISIYDMSGKKIRTLVSANRQKGDYAFDWNKQDLHDGIYYLRIISILGIISKKIVITHE